MKKQDIPSDALAEIKGAEFAKWQESNSIDSLDLYLAKKYTNEKFLQLYISIGVIVFLAILFRFFSH